MNFSLILPTRRRIGKLTNLINSVYYSTRDKNNIEVLVGYDKDDEWTKNVIEPLEHDFKDINLKFFEFERLDNLHTYYNDLAKHSKGATFIMLNDDSRFDTDGWDILAQRKISEYADKYKDGIYYGYCDDKLKSHRHGNYCCFPFLSRVVYDILGYVQDDRFPWGGADILLGNMLHQIDRVIDLKEVVIDHMSFHNYADIPKDELYEDNSIRFKNCLHGISTVNTTATVKLQEHIRKA